MSGESFPTFCCKRDALLIAAFCAPIGWTTRGRRCEFLLASTSRADWLLLTDVSLQRYRGA